MPFSLLQKQLEQSSGKKLKLTINDNRSTMLSVKWLPDETVKVSLHNMFLDAPQNVMESLACYIHKKQKSIAPPVKAFITEKRKTLDYSSSLPSSSIETQGNFYNLQEIYQALNKEYFGGSLKLNITWFGTRKNRNKSQITFGLYCDTMKLIKISRIMDTPSFPEYVVAFVVYHEMLHHTCPPTTDSRGFNQVHNREFKSSEAKFKYFTEAKAWLKKNQAALFS